MKWGLYTQFAFTTFYSVIFNEATKLGITCYSSDEYIAND